MTVFPVWRSFINWSMLHHLSWLLNQKLWCCVWGCLIESISEISDESSITHPLAQYQSCLQAAIYLNQLLRFLLKSTNPAEYINGTFVHFVSRTLENQQSDPDLYIENVLGQNPDLLSQFKRLDNYLNSFLPYRRVPQHIPNFEMSNRFDALSMSQDAWMDSLQ